MRVEIFLTLLLLRRYIIKREKSRGYWKVSKRIPRCIIRLLPFDTRFRFCMCIRVLIAIEIKEKKKVSRNRRNGRQVTKSQKT